MKNKKTKKRKKTARNKSPRGKKRLKYRKKLKRLAKIHSTLTVLFLIGYFIFGLLMGPGFFQNDLGNKYAWAATTLTTLNIHLAGPPVKPIVAAATGCDVTSPYVELSWNSTNDTDNYDVYRSGLPLVSGITDTSYKDEGVNASTTYTYYVVANGPYGSTASDGINATTGECGAPILQPSCTIITIDKINATNLTNIPKITDRTPKFTGTTNIPLAEMRFEIYTGPNIVVSSVANANGYWSFQVPAKLDYGLHRIYVTATDPNDALRFKVATLDFRIIHKGEEEEGKKAPAKISVQQNQENGLANQEKAPFALQLEVENKDGWVYGGSDLITKLTLTKFRDFKEVGRTVKYEVIDASGRVVLEKDVPQLLRDGESFYETINIPGYLKEGTYTIRAETQADQFLIRAENTFEIKEKPVFNLGGGLIITYPVIVSSLGTLSLAFLLILLIFLLLLAREYWLSLKAVIEVDEKELGRDGFIS